MRNEKRGAGIAEPPVIPIELSATTVTAPANVSVLGYPAADSNIPEHGLMHQIYGNMYDRKRLAPGDVTSIESAICRGRAATSRSRRRRPDPRCRPIRRYVLGALLLDLEDPSRVWAALDTPLLEPDGSQREGYVPNVVYSCGAMPQRPRSGASVRSVRPCRRRRGRIRSGAAREADGRPVERKIKHPAVAAICEVARKHIFA
jgi:hypothetical protein